MKIVHISDYYQPQIGYQEPNIAKIHKELGHEVHVITADRYYPFPNYKETFQTVLGKRIVGPTVEIVDGVIVHRLPCYFEYAPSAIIALRGLSKKLKKIQPDLVISHDILNLTPYISAGLKKKLGYGLIFDNHAAAFNSNVSDSLLKRMYVRLWKMFIRPKILKNADNIVAIGREEKDLALALLEVEEPCVEIIPLGADIERFKPHVEDGLAIRQDLGISEDQKVLIHAGKLTPNKKVGDLIEAFSNVIKMHPNTILLIVGNGDKEYLEELQMQAHKTKQENNIIWKNFVPNEELPKYFNAADIGVWPGNPSNVVQEAVSCGLPVVVSDHATNRYLTHTDDCGYTKKPFQSDDRNGCIVTKDKDITSQILFLLDHEEERKKMAKLARIHAKMHLSWTIVAKRFLEGMV